jgi:hypothetical protein
MGVRRTFELLNINYERTMIKWGIAQLQNEEEGVGRGWAGQDGKC